MDVAKVLEFIERFNQERLFIAQSDETLAFAVVSRDMVRAIGMAFGKVTNLDEQNSVELMGVPLLLINAPPDKLGLWLTGSTPEGRIAEHMRAYFAAHRKLPRRIIVPRDMIAEIPEEWHLPLGAPLSVKVHDHNVILMGE